MAGIESLVQEKVAANSSNPAKLQQTYAQNQQLIDLLALQKLLSEKQAASRQMQLAAAQGGLPPTVAKQREQQVMDMTRNEVMQDIGGGLQQLMSQMENARAPSRPQGQPGMPSPQQPQRMAGGGIVSLQSGGEVEEVDYNDPTVRAALRERVMDPLAWLGKMLWGTDRAVRKPRSESVNTNIDTPISYTPPHMREKPPRKQLEEFDTSQIPAMREVPRREQAPVERAEPAQSTAPSGIQTVATQPSEYKKQLQEYKELLARQQDPDKLRREQLIDYLIGGSQGTSVGTTLAGAGAAGQRTGRAQEAQIQQNAAKMVELAREDEQFAQTLQNEIDQIYAKYQNEFALEKQKLATKLLTQYKGNEQKAALDALDAAMNDLQFQTEIAERMEGIDDPELASAEYNAALQSYVDRNVDTYARSQGQGGMQFEDLGVQ